MVACQSANQLKTPAKVSWAFKMVSQFGSLGYTIMGKTADLTVVQKTNIGKRKKCGRKRCTTNRENRRLMRIVKQNRRIWVDFTRNGLRLGSRHQEPPHTVVSRNLAKGCRQGRLTWTKEKKNWTVAQWSKVLFSDESKFCISFENQGPRVWRKGEEDHSPSWLKSSVKFPQSVMIWGAMSSAGVGPLCFLKTNVTVPV